MNFWTDAAVHAALGVGGHAADVSYTSVSTDSRTIPDGGLFVALVGARFNGHDYLAEVAQKGARGAVVSTLASDRPHGLVYYLVEDTLEALGQLGRYRRRQLDARVCAVTGSNGKTTTKEMLRALLGTRYRVHATSGNLNNRIGTPLTLLAAPDDAEALVIELGTSLPGEIAQLGDIVEPDAAVVTAISEEHLEGLGDLLGVLQEETSILNSLRPGGFAVVADEPAELAEHARSLVSHPERVKVAGWTERADADLRAADVQLDERGDVRFRWQQAEVYVPLRGRHNVRNALIALGVARAWGVDLAQATAVLTTLKPAKMRNELHEFGQLTVIADCYNSNPASLASAIDLLESMPHKRRRVAIVGSMLELGPTSAALHQRAAQQIADARIDLVVATGEFVAAFATLREEMGSRLILSPDPLEAWDALGPRLRGEEVVLLKGSRGVALERLLPRLEEHGQTPPTVPGAGSATASRSSRTTPQAERSRE
ncbi:MAG: UDP-N-acetylmuramoyl-tripeptide--D-alanyl-D-alanine ligase [Longimicrobiales bacterium]